MKRILALLLVLAMSVGLFAGCRTQTPDITTEPTTQATEQAQPDLQLEKAIEYLRAFYKNAAEKTPMDYTRLGTVRIGITAYDVVWSVDVPEDVLKIVKNEDGTYTIDINEEAFKESTEPTPYVLTATITGKDGRELTISWNHIVPAAIDEESIDVIKKAYALAPGETLEGTYTVIGVIKAIKTPYDPSYKNITVTIEVPGAEDMPLVCYRLKGDGADKLAVGDTITVTGSFTNYNGQIQFAAGCILEAVESGGGAAPVAPENPVDILKQAYALAPGNSLPYNCTLSGVITFVDQAYSPDFGNVTVTMKTHGYTIKCYRIKGDGADQLNVNDEITVSGVITNYNGTIEFAAGSILVSRVDHEPPAKQPDPTPGSTLTVAQAYNVGLGKDHDTYTEGNYYITGKIVSIENDIYGNMHISDGTGKLMIYGTWSEDGNTRYDKLNPKPAVGDTVTLYGKIGRYGSNPQMKNAWIIGAKGDTPVIPDAPSVDKVTELVAGTPYRFGMAQGNLENAVYYLKGGMDGYYMGTTADPAAAINVYVEETAGGLYFYTLSGETKLYINMVVSADGAHVNGAYEATASTVYTYNAAKNTLIATVDGAEYWFGTRNDKTYTTMGPCKVELEGFFAQFYVGSEETPEQPEQPEDPEQPAESLKEGVAYTISAVNGKGTLWFNGTVSSGRFNGSYNESEAVLVYAENVEGGFLLYFMDGETKQYICIDDVTTGGSFSTDAASATVFEWNAEKATAAVAEDSNNRGFGVGATSTYDNFSAYDLSGTYNWGQFIPVDGGSTDPDVPACEHKNTKVEGAVDATCTTDGHTGKTVCTDCGETVNAGDVIPATGHNFVNGTCTKCGEAESEEPETPAGLTFVDAPVVGTAYKFAMQQNGLSGSPVLGITGAMDGFYYATTETVADMIDVYLEEADGGYHIYFMDGTTKTYLDIIPRSNDATKTNVVFQTSGEHSVYVLNTEFKYAMTDVNGTDWYLGTYGTFKTVSASKTSYISDTSKIGVSQFCAWFATNGTGGSVEPECKHTNTKVEGAKDATCTEAGYTGDTVCADCGETITKGEDIPAIPHNFVNGTCSVCGEKDPNYTEPETPAGLTFVDAPVVGTAYKFAMQQNGLSGSPVLGITGAMDGFYYATTETVADMIDVYLEEADGGYHIYFMDGTTKTYLDIIPRSNDATKTNVVFQTSGEHSVYVLNTEFKYAMTDVNGTDWYLGTYGTFKTVSASKTSYISDTSKIGVSQFCAWFATNGTGGSVEPECKHTNTKVEGAKDATCTTDGYTGDTVCTDCGETISKGDVVTATGHNFENGTCTKCGEADPNYTPDEPEEPATGLKEGVGYTISAANSKGTLWFNGTVGSGRFNGSYNESEAVLVYVENVDGGFLLYFMNGETKQYICMADSSTGGSFSTDAASATVFEWNADKATAAVAEDSNNRGFGCQATSTYSNFSCYDLSNNYNWGQFIPVEGGSTEPDVPTCEHKNTKVEGAVEATCTTDGHTGKTVCVDCGETVNAGDVIPATGHNFVNGTCSACGATDPNYTPDEPEEPATGLKEGVGYTISAANSKGTLWFNGTVGSGRFNGSYNESEAVLVYVENVDGGFLLYFMNGETKQYICMADSSTGGSFSTDAASATIYEWNADKATAAVAEDSNNRGFGCQATSTYSNFSCYDLSNNYNWGQFIPVEGGSTEPEDPFCQHLHTDNKGYVAATCTTDGYTGDTVCADCGEILSKGDVVTATGHNFVNGTCSVCGEKDPNYTEPETPAGLSFVDAPVVGTAYKFAMQQNGLSGSPVLGITGAMDGYYYATTETVADMIDVYLEEADGGYHIYFMDGTTKTYLDIIPRSNDATKTNVVFQTSGEHSVYVLNTEFKYTMTDVNGTDWYLGTYGTFKTVSASKTSYISDTSKIGVSQFCAWFATNGTGGSEPEAPEFEHVIENGGGYAASLSEDGTQLDCFQFGNEGAIFYTNYFTEKPAEGYYELREYNGKFYYTSAPSWGVIAYESITISGKTAQLKMYDDEAMVELELIAENQYKITTGNGNLPAGLVFTFGAEYCEVLGHLGVRNCEEDVKCTRCETVICGPTGHEYGEDGVCFRCFSAMRPEEPAAPAGDKADFETIVTSNANGDASYTKTFTSANGWVTVNSAIQCGGPAGCSNPQYTVIGPDNTHKAVCLNGKVGAAGSLTSPVLTGGISKLTMRYTHMFSDKNLSVTITVTDKATGATYTKVVEQTVAGTADKFTVENVEWVLETPVTGEFTIEVVNNCPSASTSNKDRFTILELAWEGAVAAHEHSYTVTSTATCTADGEATYTCECGDTYTEAASKLGHIDENLDVECDREGCTSKVAPAANSKLSTFTANCLGSKLSTDYQYYVEGTIVEVLDAKNGIFLIDDGTGETFYFRLPKNAEGVSHASWAIKLTLGDKVSVYGKINKYSSNTAPNGQFWPAIQGGVVTVLEQHPHDFTFTPATCSAPAYCACGQSHGEPLGCADNNGDDLCDDCGKNVKLVYEYIAIRTDNGSGVHDATAYTYTWSNANFDVQVAKASGGNLYVTAKDHMRLYKGNQLILANKNGITVKTITVYLTNATQVTNFEKFLTGYTYTKDVENFTVTIEVNSAETLTLLNPSSNGSTTQIKGVEFGYEK